ncbi:MAG TPA: redoxin domain-containing protein [Terriglobales bacterium]|nr:redoxin domain-containing protein [Terriglobales bacterium]
MKRTGALFLLPGGSLGLEPRQHISVHREGLASRIFLRAAAHLTACMRRHAAALAAVLLLAFAGPCPAQVVEVLRAAPEFPKNAVWLDAGVPHTVEGYRGKVVLVDFWEYTCINCIRDFAVVKRWYRKYHAYGFEVIGVHYGEFPMGFNVENVRRAAARFRLPWPVVADLKGSIWNAYDSNNWPNRYLIDPKGEIVLQVIGETGDRELENRIRGLLAKAHPEVEKVPLDADPDTFGGRCGYPTQETYIGFANGRGAVENPHAYSKLGQVQEFAATRPPSDGGVVLAGRWQTLPEGVTSAAADASAYALHKYHARSLYAVLSAADPAKPVRVELLQDGSPLAKEDAGADVRFDAKGAYLEVGEPRMYDLVKNRAFGQHILALKPQGPGFTLLSFTYGNDCQQEFEER